MNKKLPGFEKSAPVSHPKTKGQKAVSAWDMDLSPIHRLIEQQASSTQQLTDIFTHKMEEFLSTLREERRQGEKKLQAMQAKFTQLQKMQTKSNSAICDGIAEIAEHMGNVQSFLQETSERYFPLLENVQSNTYNLIRPVTAQENLLREGAAPAQLIQPLEKLVVLKEDSVQQGEDMLSALESWHAFQEFTKKKYVAFLEKLGDCEQKIENIENVLIGVGANLQKQLPNENLLQKKLSQLPREQSKLLKEISSSCNQIFQSLNNSKNIESMEILFRKTQESLERQLSLMEQERKFRRRDNIFFWGFIAISLVIFTCILAFSK